MWQGKKLAMVDTLDALELIQWAYDRANHIEQTDGNMAAYLRDAAESALSGLVIVLKRRSAPVPQSVIQSLEILGDSRERRKVA